MNITNKYKYILNSNIIASYITYTSIVCHVWPLNAGHGLWARPHCRWLSLSLTFPFLPLPSHAFILNTWAGAGAGVTAAAAAVAARRSQPQRN